MAEELDERIRASVARRRAHAAWVVDFEERLAADTTGEPAALLRAAVERAVGVPVEVATADQLMAMARLLRLRATWRRERRSRAV
jgi:hypothetical protein